jgi:hypothetical protein
MAATIDPTKAEIAERSAEVRAEWSAVTEMRRRGLSVDEKGNVNARHEVLVYRRPNVIYIGSASD